MFISIYLLIWTFLLQTNDLYINYIQSLALIPLFSENPNVLGVLCFCQVFLLEHKMEFAVVSPASIT